jgi:Mandelate racemase / muconate lactonizing enzyme, N-terminal domain
MEVGAYTVPTDFPESDGTLEWNATTLVLVHAYGGDRVGLGYTYADSATATLIRDLFSEVVRGHDAMAPAASWNAMVSRIRNLGRPGIASMAISAVDIALWDLKARLLNIPPTASFRCRAELGSHLRQWRIHVVYRSATSKAAYRLGQAAHYTRKDEGGPQCQS